MKTINTLSIIIPVYNEEKTIQEIIERVMKIDLGRIKKEIIVVNDGSTDSTRLLLNTFDKRDNFTIIHNDTNQGKGYSIRSGLMKASGEALIIQDGDLEYDPRDYKRMIDKITESKEIHIVYGSRRLKNNKYIYIYYYVGGVILTTIANLIYKINLTDITTCYKMIDINILKKIHIDANRFDYCAELTAKISKMGYKIYEVPVAYTPRRISEGKKIRLPDFFRFTWALLKYRFTS